MQWHMRTYRIDTSSRRHRYPRLRTHGGPAGSGTVQHGLPYWLLEMYTGIHTRETEPSYNGTSRACQGLPWCGQWLRGHAREVHRPHEVARARKQRDPRLTQPGDDAAVAQQVHRRPEAKPRELRRQKVTAQPPPQLEQAADARGLLAERGGEEEHGEARAEDRLPEDGLAQRVARPLPWEAALHLPIPEVRRWPEERADQSAGQQARPVGAAAAGQRLQALRAPVARSEDEAGAGSLGEQRRRVKRLRVAPAAVGLCGSVGRSKQVRAVKAEERAAMLASGSLRRALPRRQGHVPRRRHELLAVAAPAHLWSRASRSCSPRQSSVAALVCHRIHFSGEGVYS